MKIKITKGDDLYHCVGVPSEAAAMKLAMFIAKEQTMLDEEGSQLGHPLLERIQNTFSDEEILVMAGMAVRATISMNDSQKVQEKWKSTDKDNLFETLMREGKAQGAIDAAELHGIDGKAVARNLTYLSADKLIAIRQKLSELDTPSAVELIRRISKLNPEELDNLI